MQNVMAIINSRCYHPIRITENRLRKLYQLKKYVFYFLLITIIKESEGEGDLVL